jgi:hypothetical protein
LVSVALIFHLAAVVAGALGVPPSSLLERRFADLFMPYHDLVDQGYAYRYYAEPPPTPVVTGTIRFQDGRPDVSIRLPDRALGWPRMRHQRQLALANALFGDVRASRERNHDPDEASRSQLVAAYARHLCHAYEGCKSVTLHLQQHLIPDPSHVRESLEGFRAEPFDLFQEDLFTPPDWIGDYECEGS